jgi:hypothetical protein
MRWPLSAAGFGLLMFSAATLAFGRARMDIVLTLASLFWFGLSLLTGLAAGLAAVLLSRELTSASGRHGPALQGLEGRPSLSGVTFGRRLIPLAARPAVTWVTPRGACRLVGAESRFAESITPRGRVRATEVVREIAQEDLFGLWRFRWRTLEARPVLWLPDPGRLTAADLAACLATGDLLSHPYAPARGDLIDARLYTRSDPARLILWKVYARTRQLLVRAPEQARSPDRHPLVYFVAGPHDDAAAGAARLIVESGIFGEGARFATDGSPAPVTDRNAAIDALCASVDHRERGGADLAAALGDPLVDADDPVVLVVAADAGGWQPRVLDAIARRPERFAVLACGDAAAPSPRTGGSWGWRRWRNWFVRPAAIDGRPFGTLVRSIDPLVCTGARVALAERRSGRVIVLSGDATVVVPELRTA